MATFHSYDKVGELTKLGEINKSWRLRIFALSVDRKVMLYFRTKEDYEKHISTGANTQAGTINLGPTSTYVCDYMDADYCIEIISPRNPCRFYHLHAQHAEELVEWISFILMAGSKPVAPSNIMRLVLPRSERENDKNGNAGCVLPCIPHLGKRGYLQKRGHWNTAFQTRFFRTLRDDKSRPILAYFGGPEAYNMKGSIPLFGDNFYLEDVQSKEAGADDLGFIIHSEKRAYQLRAPSKAHKRQWMTIIRALAAGSNRLENEEGPSVKIMQQEEAQIKSGLLGQPVHDNSRPSMVDHHRTESMPASPSSSNSNPSSTAASPRNASVASPSSSSPARAESTSSTPSTAAVAAGVGVVAVGAAVVVATSPSSPSTAGPTSPNSASNASPQKPIESTPSPAPVTPESTQPVAPARRRAAKARSGISEQKEKERELESEHSISHSQSQSQSVYRPSTTVTSRNTTSSNAPLVAAAVVGGAAVVGVAAVASSNKDKEREKEQQLERERQDKERQERERQDREKAEQEKMEQERREKVEQQQRERQQQEEREAQEKERQRQKEEQERTEREKQQRRQEQEKAERERQAAAVRTTETSVSRRVEPSISKRRRDESPSRSVSRAVASGNIDWAAQYKSTQNRLEEEEEEKAAEVVSAQKVMTPSEFNAALLALSQGVLCMKIPTSSFASPKKVAIYLIPLQTNAGKKLLADSRQEIQKKYHKDANKAREILEEHSLASTSDSDFLLKWDSTKGIVYESFIMLGKGNWVFTEGMEAGQFAKDASLRKKFDKQHDTAFTIVSKTRSLDLVCLDSKEYQLLKKTLDHVKKLQNESS